MNGSTGYLRKIDYERRTPTSNNQTDTDGNTVDRKPFRLWIEFEEERSAMKLIKSQKRICRVSGITEDTWTMITPIATSRNKALQLNRKQFPVVLAEAPTVHK